MSWSARAVGAGYARRRGRHWARAPGARGKPALEAVGAYLVIAALTLADPGRSDAVFRRFLYSLASRTMRFSPSRPKSGAIRVGIPATEAIE
jgi:hypothetical protein